MKGNSTRNAKECLEGGKEGRRKSGRMRIGDGRGSLMKIINTGYSNDG